MKSSTYNNVITLYLFCQVPCSLNSDAGAVKRPLIDERIRLPQDQTVGDLSPAELLERFWQASHVPEADVEALQKLAAEILQEEEEMEESAEEEVVEVESTIPALQEMPAQ